jgi:glutathionylspermidine synthase
MKQIQLQPRPNRVEELQRLEFKFEMLNGRRYWIDDYAYSFTLDQIEQDLEDPTNQLVAMTYEAVRYILSDIRNFDRLKIPRQYFNMVKASWDKQDRDLYGRFDLSYNGKSPAKLLEYNADTPTSLYEASVLQWAWLRDRIEKGTLSQDTDQFNSIHERLVACFKQLKSIYFNDETVFNFVGALDDEEDAMTLHYLADCAMKSFYSVGFTELADVHVQTEDPFFRYFIDGQTKKPIEVMFKLYPYEMLLQEPVAGELLTTRTRLFEPYWKMLLSNKGLLPILWELYPHHPNLLEAYFEDDPHSKKLENYARKPIFSREGANVALVRQGLITDSEKGVYGEEGYIRQALHELPKFETGYPVIGSWVVQGESAGIGIRESDGLITNNTSRFVPHVIQE